MASETTVDTFEAQLQQIKMREPRRWQATNGCEAEKVTSSAAFCAEVASVQSKIAAARKRDEIDANLTALHSKVEGVVVPEVEDVYVANVAAFLTAGGVKVTPDIKRLIAADGDDFLRTVRGRQAARRQQRPSALPGRQAKAVHADLNPGTEGSVGA